MAALLDIVKKGSTSRSVTLRIVDSGDGTPETGVVFNTSGIDLWYRRESSAKVSITEATLAALTTAYASGGFLHISDGEYRLDLPDAAYATGANHVDVGGTVTGMIVIGGRVRLVDYDPEDTVRLGLTALPNAAAEAAGGLYTRGSGAGQLNQQANGQHDINVARWLNTAVATPNTNGVPVVDARALGRINTAQAGGSNSITLDAAASATTDFYVGASVSLLSGTGAEQNGRIITAYNGTTKVATITPNWATSPTSSSVFAIVPAGVSLEAWLRSAPNALATGDVPANTKQVNSSSAAAIRSALATNLYIPGTVTNAALSPTTTQFECSDITTAAADHYVGREVYFTTGTLTSQRASISAYSLVSGRGRFTVTALTSAPANGDTLIVV